MMVVRKVATMAEKLVEMMAGLTVEYLVCLTAVQLVDR